MRWRRDTDGGRGGTGGEQRERHADSIAKNRIVTTVRPTRRIGTPLLHGCPETYSTCCWAFAQSLKILSLNYRTCARMHRTSRSGPRDLRHSDCHKHDRQNMREYVKLNGFTQETKS